ncbi:hypothetical protein QFC21_000231 [Naganishia friedmannii]|uniref:Uncharacterized protein n=1 Tax=Naganishia friedmannii TaxID=89922 RepID=A0ACC2WAX2_9TREE|nr:hypothetical protein QFC21_000231 [Naganishia friedmannii]
MQRLEQSYPEDMAAFERSFPPLCEMCAPKVEDVIKKKDYEAQINAWKMILQDAGQVSARTPNRVMPRTGSRHLERSIAAAWSIVTIAYPPYQLVSGKSWLKELLKGRDIIRTLIDGNLQARILSCLIYSGFGLSSILLHGLPHKILGSLLVLASYVATVRLLLDLRASSKAAQLRLARQNIQARGSGGIKHHNNPDGMSQRSQGPNDPFNLISLINNVSPAHGTKITSAHDPDQPRSSPMIQLSPSPEMEPLSMPNILPALNNSVDPDFMDWEATEPAVNSAINIGAQKATSAWDRFATTKQRIFVKDQLTGLERAFETWRDLGGNANSETTQHQATTPTVFKRVRARRRSVERAAYMLASVLRILSLALTWPTRARVLSAETGRESGTGFGIAASVVEAVIASPQIASSQNWGLQIVLGQTAFANQDMLIDSVMAVLDIAAWTVS